MLRAWWMWPVPFGLLLFVAVCDGSSSAAPPSDSPEADAGTADASDAAPAEDASDAELDADSGAIEVPAGFVLVDAGSFQMGSPPGEPGRSADTEALHDVVLTRSLLVKATEVTQAEWLAKMDVNPSYFTDCGEGCPVEYITFWEALDFCNALSQAEGLSPCYELVGCSGELGLDFICDDVVVNAEGASPPSCEGYRLPTEAEWEYAARAGTATAFPAGGFASGESPDEACGAVAALASTGWYCGNSVDTPHPVASKQANAWGLYDTTGNVLEWVWDRYAPYAEAPGVSDPLGPAEGALRVLRGGSWSSSSADCRSAARRALDPAERDGDTGLRPVRTVLP